MAINKEYNDIQLDVKFTQASSRANIVSEENISVSFSKLANWFEALVPTGGSSGQFLGWNSDGTAKWVSNPNSDTKVKNTYGTANTYYPAGMTQSSTTTTTQVADTSFKFIGTTGTTSEIGKAQLVLGNNIAAGTANNKQGSLVIYGSTAYAHTLIADSGIPTENRTLYLPDKTDTLAVVGDIPTLYAGSNSTGGSALTVYGTLTNPSGQASYAIPFHTDISSGDKSLLNNDGIVYTCKQGTASATGFSIIELGNGINEGTAGNKYGLIRLYSRQGGDKYVQLYPATKLTANRNIVFPNAAGTIALTTDIPAVNDASLTLKGDGTDVVVFTANSASDKSLNITAGSNVTITPTAAGSNGAGTIQIASSHPTITKSADTTSTVSPAHGGTFTTVDTVTRDAYGHVTKINTKTVTLPTIQISDAGSILTPVYFSNNAPVESSGKTIPFIVGTGSTAGTWLGSLEGLTAYYDGLIILYKIPVAGASTTTLNINNLGAKTCYVNNTTKLTTHFPANQPIFLVYSENQNSGCWMCLDDYWTDSDTYDRNRYRANIKAGTSALVAGNIIVGKDGVFSHLKSGGSFDISYPILYLNEAVAAEGTTKNSYDIINFTITTTQSISLTSYLPVFIKGTLSGKIFTPVSTAPLTQTVPTTDDGYQYMYLGNATSTSAVYLTERHPIYAYKNNAFGEIVHTASNVNGYTVGKSVPSDAVFTDTKVNVTLATTTKAYLLGTSTTPTATAQAVTSVADTGVYLGETAGSLYATTFYGALSGNATSSNYNTLQNITIKTGNTNQSHITLQTLMTWLITTKGYIKSMTAQSLSIYTSWSYANNDILQMEISGTNYELQLAGVIIEFIGHASDYQTGIFRLRIHSAPSTSFTPASGYTKFPTAHIAEYTCNGSGYSPIWKMITDLGDTIAIAHGGTGATTRLNALKNLTDENVGSSANYFLTITSAWGKGGYTSVADAKTVLGLKSAAYTESSEYAPSSHTHGNITSGGALQTTDITIASGDKLVVTDSSNSNKVARASISFDGSTTTKCLTQKGTWETFLASHQTVTDKNVTLAWGTQKTVATIGSTDIHVTLPGNPNTDTKNTAGSTDTSSKIYLIGATSQAANPQTYSDNEVYTTSGVLTTKKVQVGGGSCTMEYNSTTQSLDFIFT